MLHWRNRLSWSSPHPQVVGRHAHEFPRASFHVTHCWAKTHPVYRDTDKSVDKLWAFVDPAVTETLLRGTSGISNIPCSALQTVLSTTRERDQCPENGVNLDGCLAGCNVRIESFPGIPHLPVLSATQSLICLAMDLAYTCVKHQRRLYVCQGLAPHKHQMRFFVCHQMRFFVCHQMR